MKKIICFVLAALYISCAKDPIMMDEDFPKTKAEEIRYDVSPEMARTFANSFKEDGKYISEEPLVHAGDTLAYLFNYKEGWKLISSDRRTDPVLMSDKDGSLTLKKTNHPGLAIWTDIVIGQLINVRANEVKEFDKGTLNMWNRMEAICHPGRFMKEIPETKTYFDSIDGDYPYFLCETSFSSTPFYTMDTDHLIQTKWGQDDPWNEKMFYGYDDNGNIKKCYLGCAPVALSQMLYFLHYNIGKPNGLYHYINTSGFKYNQTNGSQSISRAQYSYNSDRWDQMAHHWYNSHTDYAGDFMIDVGFRMNTKYSAYGSGASLSTNDLTEYGITFDDCGYNKNTVFNEISSGKPLIVTAFAKHSTVFFFWDDYSDGHAWIIDGWRKKRYNYETTYHWIVIGSRNDEEQINWYDTSLTRYSYEQGMALSGGNEYTYAYNQSSDYDYLLMNWGYDGSYDNAEYSANTADYWTVRYLDGNTGQWVNQTYKYNVNMYYNFRSNGQPETAL